MCDNGGRHRDQNVSEFIRPYSILFSKIDLDNSKDGGIIPPSEL